MTAIQGVADRLADSEDVEMRGPHSTVSSVDSGVIGTMDELESKFSLQGTSSSKSTGKKKVVCPLFFVLSCQTIKAYLYKLLNIHFMFQGSNKQQLDPTIGKC